MPNTEQIWVGRWNNAGLMVYDPHVQIAESPCVYLYGVNSGRMRTLDPEMIRPNLTVIRNPQIVQAAIEVYSRWKSAEAESFHAKESGQLAMRREVIKAAREKSRRQEFERRRERVDTLEMKNLRTARCFHCKKSLDSQKNENCSSCGWMICNCGACGCEF